MESSWGYDYKLHIQPLTYIILRRRPNQTLLFSQNHRFGFYHSDVIGSDDSPINQNDWQLRSWFTVNPPKLCLSVIQLCDDFLWNYSGMRRGRAAAAGQINWEDLLVWFWLCLCVFWIISVLCSLITTAVVQGNTHKNTKLLRSDLFFFKNSVSKNSRVCVDWSHKQLHDIPLLPSPLHPITTCHALLQPIIC